MHTTTRLALALVITFVAVTGFAGCSDQHKCDKGDYDACFKLGACYQYGKCGVRKDLALAGELYGKACNGGIMGACVDLGHMFNDGQMVVVAFDKVVELYRKACDGKHMNGCYHLGNMYHKGLGVEEDQQEAWMLYHRACAGGESDACLFLATNKYVDPEEALRKAIENINFEKIYK
jgi:hypothetical protein